jgi:hypothetical protein
MFTLEPESGYLAGLSSDKFRLTPAHCNQVEARRSLLGRVSGNRDPYAPVQYPRKHAVAPPPTADVGRQAIWVAGRKRFLRKPTVDSLQRGCFRDQDWPRPWLGERGSSFAGRAEIACNPGGGAGAGQFVGGRHPYLREELACTITRGEQAVRVIVIRDNVEAHHNRC